MRRAVLALLLPAALMFGACQEWTTPVDDDQFVIGDGDGDWDFRQAQEACHSRDLLLKGVKQLNGEMHSVALVTCSVELRWGP